MKKVILKIIILTLIFVPAVCLSMASTNYQIIQDSINFGGTDQSTSTNYILDDTMGEVGTGFLSSTNYWAGIGYRRMLVPEPTISFAISKQSINLGQLTNESINSDSHTITVTSTGIGGYSVVVYKDGNLRTVSGDDIDNISDGTVSAGAEEYGILTSGSDGQLNLSDTAIIDGLIVASNSNATTSAVTVINYKASIDSSTTVGNYSQSLNYIISATY